MEIKCPKCRFRYEEQETPGITEMACVCPRCGTPFIHKIEDAKAPEPTSSVPSTDQQATDQDDNHTDNANRQQAENQSTTATTPSVNATTPSVNATTRSKNGSREDVNKPHSLHNSSNHQTPVRKTSHGKHTSKQEDEDPNKWRDLKRKLLIIAAIVFVVAAAINHSISHYTPTGNTEDEDKLVMTNADTTTSMHDGAKTIDDNNKWLEGAWRTNDPKTNLSFSIRGGQISVAEGGDTIAGTYRIDGEFVIYKGYNFRMDKENSCIWLDNTKFKHISD